LPNGGILINLRPQNHDGEGIAKISWHGSGSEAHFGISVTFTATIIKEKNYLSKSQLSSSFGSTAEIPGTTKSGHPQKRRAIRGQQSESSLHQSEFTIPHYIT
jgi:hypothetical protein